MAPPSSISSSDRLLSRIAILLFILVAGLLTVFGYYASSICITVVLAGFLAILFDPLVGELERLHIPRSLAAASIVLAGIGLIGLLGYALYGRAMSFAEELPVYALTIQQTIAPTTHAPLQWFQPKAREPCRCYGPQLFCLQLHQDSSYTSHVSSDGRWRHRSAVERRGPGCPLGSL